jgi:bifunctional non-homologous end joining protein LigD
LRAIGPRYRQGDRKKRLARLLSKRRIGIVLRQHTDEDGALVFQQACRRGLEGIVSKRLSAPYRLGRRGTGSR